MGGLGLQWVSDWFPLSMVAPFPPKFNLPLLWYGPWRQMVGLQQAVYVDDAVWADVPFGGRLFRIHKDDLEEPGQGGTD